MKWGYQIKQLECSSRERVPRLTLPDSSRDTAGLIGRKAYQKKWAHLEIFSTVISRIAGVSLVLPYTRGDHDHIHVYQL